MPQYKIVLFDLDDTLIHEGFELPILCDETMAVLDFLNGKAKLVLATHNYNAPAYLDTLKLTDRFDLVLAYYDLTDKVSHLWTALQKFDLRPSDAVFFDDLPENLQAVRTHGVATVLVNQEKGITLDQVKLAFS